MEETKSQYLKVIESSRKVFKDKNLDYGSSWRILRVSSFVDQIHIKAQRIRNLQINKDQKIDEGQVPEFIGIINYCIMSLIQIQIGVVDEPDLNGTEVFELYDNKVNETFELMLKKNHDYGEAWRDMEISSLTDLIIQKIFRMKSITIKRNNSTAFLSSML